MTNELKKKLDQTTTDQKDSQQKYTDLQTKSAKEKDEIKFELDSKINNIKTEFNVKFDKKGMTFDKKELTATTRQFSIQSNILGCNPVETQNLKNQKFLSKDHLLL